MRRSLLLAATIASLTCGASLADTTRTLRVSLAGDPAREFAVENLAGSMTVVAADVATVEAVATIHAESEELAAAMGFEQVRGRDGTPTLRVVYPLDRERRIRFPGAGDEAGARGHERRHHWWSAFGWDSSETTYDGHRVRVSESSGVLLFADVEVRVPRRAVEATFRNLVGLLRADGIEGTVLLDTTHGDVIARHLDGEIKADTGSGDVRAEAIRGRFVCDTGSGACVVDGFDGRELSCDTGSGEVRVSGARAERLVADTGSGGVRVERADVEEFKGDTGSGEIEAELIGSRLRRVIADTGSGGVVLRLPADASFEVSADQGSGGLECSFRDAQPVIHDKKVVGWRRADARVRISIDTGSGDARVIPAA
ncbi:MAG TPA: DUF4097 family beta strand repeat-containing protein [Thermoanaerobaculaceae bacterium]|nr:DUF4097 family beta strand repeat-containing protein [Thermoanaerobaculaceae bacterium]